jgi:uracil-DNA glycosylase
MMEKYLNPICSRIDGCEDADDIYFTNAHKCPKLSGKGSFEKRDDDALKECRDYITDEIAAVNPQVILALSKQAMNTVGRSSEVEFEGSKRVTDYVREWEHGARFYGNKPSVVAGFHPSPTYLNQNLGKAGYDNKDKEWYYEQVAISVNVALSE